MGARIAAHFANAGIPALLLDIVIPGQPNRNAAALKGIDNALKMRPAGFFTDDKAALIKPGNFEDHLGGVAECDWIIEAVTENLEIKRDLWRKVDAVRCPTAILSTNTSGIPLAHIVGRFFARVPPAVPRHPLLQSAALSAPDGADPGRRYRPAHSRLRWKNSPTGASAKASSAPRTRPTSSPTASAASSAAPSRKP